MWVMLARSPTAADISRWDGCTASEETNPRRSLSPFGEGISDGAALGSRTPDLLITSEPLCRLS